MGQHKEWRKLAKKARRKRIRQTLAQARNAEEEAERIRRETSPSYGAWLEEQRKADLYQEQEEARLAAEEETKWLKADQESVKRWNELQERLEAVHREKERLNARIRAEWDEQQRKLRELKEKNEKEAEEKRLQQECIKEEIDNFVTNGGEIPEALKTSFETNPHKNLCPFFSKTSACRFKDSCSRNHVRPAVSTTILIPSFYSHYSLQQQDSEYGSDFALEYSNYETYEHFKEFFFDVLPEMEKCGHVRQFKVCCNNELHLRGNVYVEYETLREAMKSYRMFNGRFYGGKRLSVEFSGITSWKSAICGLFFKKKCPKGNTCNFLHVFRNPGNAFANADKDLHRTPPQEIKEDDARNWRWSESPERIPRQEETTTTRFEEARHNRRRRKKRNGDRRPTRS